MALATLDSVLDNYQAEPQPALQVAQQSSKSKSGAESGKSSKKKRSKDSGNSGSSGLPFGLVHGGGGTWPRSKGGPVIDQGTGTILHPQKNKKGRLPLAELLNNMPKYPPEKKEPEPRLRNDNAFTRSNREHGAPREQMREHRSSSRHPRPHTTYDLQLDPSHFKR